MAEFNEVYRRASYYDIAFSRDVSREIEFILHEFQRLAGRPLTSILELACGPGYHVRLTAKQGIRSIGLDLRPEMTEFGRDHAIAEGVDVEWIAEDMRHFTLPEPVDAIITMYDSVDCLLMIDDLVDHFRTVARNLVPGGIYLFEMTHPRDCSPWDYGQFFYEGERNGTKVRIDWAVNGGAKVDSFHQVSEVQTRMTVTENGKTEVFTDTAKERFTMPQEFVSIIRLAGGLEVVDIYGDFKPGQRLDSSPASRRMIFLLRKPDRS